MAKIVDNPSPKELLDQLRAFESLEAIYNAVPFAKRFFPAAESTCARLQEIKKQAEILLVPDQFNETFSDMGWIAYESMNMDTMVRALATEKESGLAEAEQVIAGHYNEETLKFGIMRFHGHHEFRKRLRLIELAKSDYLAGRFHACIPLLLSMLDGLVNDVSKHIGFFANGVDLTAWDSIAAHETGLSNLAKIMRLGRNKTNEEPISIPFRNGILHGRELSFDNQLVAAKCWAAIFAVRDWAGALADGRATPKPKEKVSWSQLLQQVAENARLRKALDAWRPRESTTLGYLPSSGPSGSLPENTPERVVAEFMEDWCSGRYGLMADMLLDFLDNPRGKKAGRAKQDFGVCKPIAFRIIGVTDEAATISEVETEIVIQGKDGVSTVNVSVRVIYNDAENRPVMRGYETGAWKVVQNSFSKMIYGSPV
jgi:hypothetical protein